MRLTLYWLNELAPWFGLMARYKHQCTKRIFSVPTSQKKVFPAPMKPNHICGPGSFDLIVGNPPFGGTFDHSIEDELDNTLGKRLGKKIKKETYAFFIVACLSTCSEKGDVWSLCAATPC